MKIQSPEYIKMVRKMTEESDKLGSAIIKEFFSWYFKPMQNENLTRQEKIDLFVKLSTELQKEYPIAFSEKFADHYDTLISKIS